MTPLRCGLLMAFGMAFGPAMAGDDLPARAEGSGYFEDLPMVLTASRMLRSLHEAPASVTVLDRDLISATGYRDIARLFRLVPGMQVGQERASSQWVTYHGLGNDTPADMQVLVDGRAVYSPTSFSGVDWHGLPVTMDEIERIEIVRGTDAVAYGSNAFLGVVNIITRHTGDEPGRRVTANAGNGGIGDLRFDWNAIQGDHGLRVAAAVRRDDGFERLNDTSRMNTLSLRSDSRISNTDELTLRLASNQGDRGAGYADSIFGNNAERNWSNHTTAFQAQWRHSPAADEEVLLNFFRNENRTHDEWTAIGPRPDLGFSRLAMVPLTRNYHSVRDSIEVQHRTAASQASQLVWGAEARHETIEAPFLFHGVNSLANRLFRLFGNLEWRPGTAWTANVGGMAEKYTDDRARLSPRLFVNWHAAPDATLRAGYSRAWRDRNYFERYGDVRVNDPADGRVLVRPYVPNPDLRPPRIDSLELGYLARYRPGNTTVDLRLFNERITDFVVRTLLPSTPDNPVLAVYVPATRYDNLDAPVTLRGLEYRLQTHLRPQSRLLLSHALIQRRTTDPAVASRVAPYTASLSWLEDWGGGWSSMASLLRMGPLAGGDGYVPRFQYQAAPYTTADIRLAHRRRVGGQWVEIALSALNLGSRHQEIADRSEQFLHPEGPINPVSRMVFLSLTIASR